MLTRAPEGRSAQENVGHLIDLESLLRRAAQYLANEAELVPTDLANRRTTDANHNARRLDDLLVEFRAERGKLIQLPATADDSVLARRPMHPRLGRPMRLIELAEFVADHDDHHLAVIGELGESRDSSYGSTGAP